jgi:hypothetical protein
MAGVGMTIAVQGCGPTESKAGGNYENHWRGADGSDCYVVYDSGRAVGGNCK